MPLAFCKSFSTKKKERLTSYLSIIVVVVVVVVVNECGKVLEKCKVSLCVSYLKRKADHLLLRQHHPW